jgi:hypothetical protein
MAPQSASVSICLATHGDSLISQFFRATDNKGFFGAKVNIDREMPHAIRVRFIRGIESRASVIAQVLAGRIATREEIGA